MRKGSFNEEGVMVKYGIVILLVCFFFGCGGGGGSDSSPTSSTQTATALCNDGTYSYSQNCSGTCSSHGGVKIWYVSNCGG